MLFLPSIIMMITIIITYHHYHDHYHHHHEIRPDSDYSLITIMLWCSYQTRLDYLGKAIRMSMESTWSDAATTAMPFATILHSVLRCRGAAVVALLVLAIVGIAFTVVWGTISPPFQPDELDEYGRVYCCWWCIIIVLLRLFKLFRNNVQPLRCKLVNFCTDRIVESIAATFTCLLYYCIFCHLNTLSCTVHYTLYIFVAVGRRS